MLGHVFFTERTSDYMAIIVFGTKKVVWMYDHMHIYFIFGKLTKKYA